MVHTLTVAMDETHTPFTHLLTDDLLPVVKRGQTILQDKLEKPVVWLILLSQN